MIRRLLWRARLLFLRFLGREPPRLAILVPPSPEEVRRRLHDRLFQVARRMRLPVLPYPAQKMVHEGTPCAGQYRHGAIRYVRIHEGYLDCPWVLAHEIGHARVCAGGYRAHAESDADREALAICRQLLLPHELAVVEGEMRAALDGSGTTPARTS